MLNESYVFLADHGIEVRTVFCSHLASSCWFLAVGSERDSLVAQKGGMNVDTIRIE